MAELWPIPVGFLYGWVDTSVPGYRRWSEDSTAYQLPDAYQPFWDLVTAIDNTSAAIADLYGRVTVQCGPKIVTWTDTLGWLLGMDVEPGQVEAQSGDRQSRVPCPGAIPCADLGVESVDRDREQQLVMSRWGRPYGWVWGAGAEIWRCRVKLHRLAVPQLRFLRRGKITISPWNIVAHQDGDDVPYSPAQPFGTITGHVLGWDEGGWVRGQPDWWRGVLYLVTTVAS